LLARSSILDSRRKPMREQVALFVVVVIPFLATLCTLPVAREWGISWDIAILGVAFYMVSMLGITVGFHRLFTHRAFRASRVLRICLAVMGSLAIQGPLLRWVADHRRHHAFADREGDPHSPWRYGTGFWPLLKGMLFAHIGWLFDTQETNQAVFASDLGEDADARIVSRLFGLFAVVSLALPPLIEFAFGASLDHIIATFFWASLIRVFMVHHVTWSVNSVCHVLGSRRFSTKDKAANFWPLAILSMGEAWHNGHHAAPSCARHGVEKGQIDLSACVISLFERLGWVTNVKWADQFAYRVRTPGPPKSAIRLRASRGSRSRLNQVA
jgi:stearoyl-CoA desaturase (Delta-9 desaturase)